MAQTADTSSMPNDLAELLAAEQRLDAVVAQAEAEAAKLVARAEARAAQLETELEAELASATRALETDAARDVARRGDEIETAARAEAEALQQAAAQAGALARRLVPFVLGTDSGTTLRAEGDQSRDAA